VSNLTSPIFWLKLRHKWICQRQSSHSRTISPKVSPKNSFSPLSSEQKRVKKWNLAHLKYILRPSVWSKNPVNRFVNKRDMNFLKNFRGSKIFFYLKIYLFENFWVSATKFTNCLLNSRIILVDHLLFRFLISWSIPEIFAVKICRCPKLHRILHVFCPCNFLGCLLPKICIQVIMPT